MSPYVRKTAALSIPKLLILDEDLIDEAVSLIETLLKDKTTHVLGSVVAAFTQVCPNRLDLLHPHYRKFVSLLPDFDEWGQVVLIQLLTRYARTQFIDPLKSLEQSVVDKRSKLKAKMMNKPIKDDDDSEDEDSDDDEDEEEEPIDLDLRMLFKNCRPLLQSRNSSVVFSVLQLHLAMFLPTEGNPSNLNSPLRNGTADGHGHEIDSEEKKLVSFAVSEAQTALLNQYLSPCIKPLVRLIASSSSHREIQQLVLSCIVSLTCKSLLAKSFEPYLRSFFVKTRDPVQVKLLKLQVLTNLSTSSNIALILREFQAYVNTYSSDAGIVNESESSLFVSSVITAIGDVATRIREVAEVCLKGLIALLSNRSNEAIVAQAVIVIRTQIMNREREARMIANGFLDSTESASSTGSTSLESQTEVTSLIIKQLVSSKLMETDPSEVGIKDKSGKTAWSKARATILWILAEFCCKNSKAYSMSPDVLRKFAKSFPQESDLVKLQVLNLAAKMSIVTKDCYTLGFLEKQEDKATLFDRQRFQLLVSYIFNLAKYDLNYDIRDRARFLKSLINTASNGTAAGEPIDSQSSDQTNEGNFESVRSILFDKKQDSLQMDSFESGPESKKYRRKKYIGFSRFRVGTLAHFLNIDTPGYEELPSFPLEAPDASVRAPPPEPVRRPPSPVAVVPAGRTVPSTARSTVSAVKTKEPKFYSDEESDDDEEESDSEEDSSEEESGEESDDEEESEESSEDDDEQEQGFNKKTKSSDEEDSGEVSDTSSEGT